MIRPFLLLLLILFSLFSQRSFAVENKKEIASIPVQQDTIGELTAEQAKRLKNFLPRTFEKLRTRSPLHTLALGDSVTRYFTRDENINNTHKSYHSHFLRMLAEKFSYTGGLRDIKPKNKHPQKIENHFGPEITLENFGMNGRICLDAIRRLRSDAFLNNPDLIFVNFGLNDMTQGVSLATYIATFKKIIAICQEKKTDLLLFASTVMGPTSATDLGDFGRTRSYAAALKKLAKENNILCIDLGKLMIENTDTSIEPDTQNAYDEFLLSLKNFFESPQQKADNVHPSEKAHLLLGKKTFDQIFVPPLISPYTLSGYATPKGNALEVQLTLTNKSNTTRFGQLRGLKLREHFIPSTTLHPFSLKPNESTEIHLTYTSPQTATLPTDSLWSSDPKLFFPALIIEATQNTLLEPSLETSPLSVTWQSGLVDQVQKSFPVNFSLYFSKKYTAQGNFTLSFEGQKHTGLFSPTPGKPQNFSFLFSLPQDKRRINGEIKLEITQEKQTYHFRKHIEGLQNIGLNEKIPLLKVSPEYNSIDQNILLCPRADQQALYLTYDFQNIPIERNSEQPTINISLHLDGRSYGKRRHAGFVGDILLSLPYEGAGQVKATKQGFLGDGYGLPPNLTQIHALSIPRKNGEHRVEITLPRHFFKLHEWSLGNGNSLLGINTRVNILQINKENPEGNYPPEYQWILTRNRRPLSDPFSLNNLELTEKPTKRWSLRID